MERHRSCLALARADLHAILREGVPVQRGRTIRSLERQDRPVHELLEQLQDSTRVYVAPIEQVAGAAWRDAGTVTNALAGFVARRSPRTDWVRAQTHRRDRTRNLPPAVRNLTLRAFGRRIFRSNYRPLLQPI
jgi:hypothetical protein